LKTESKKSFFKRIPQFGYEVKQEVKKVNWPSRRETIITTIMVFIFSVIASLFFLLVDKIIIAILDLIKGL
jgi:preprotein translocase subunit SecE